VLSLFESTEDISLWIVLIPGAILLAVGGYFLLKHPAAIPVPIPAPEEEFPSEAQLQV
jgi:hypothetical protein